MAVRGTFALVERAMRVDTRLARTHLIRLGFAALILLFVVQVQRDISNYNAPGRDVFRSMCWVNFFLLNLAGVSFFSTVITEEKEELTDEFKDMFEYCEDFDERDIEECDNFYLFGELYNENESDMDL